MEKRDEIEEFRDNLRRLERIILSRVRKSSHCCGLTVNQGHILLCLSRSGGTGLSELNGELRLDKASLSRTVALLAEKGYVKQRENRYDRRAQILELTDEGQEFVTRIDGASLESFGRVYEGLEGKFRGEMNGYLKELLESMVRMNFTGEDCDDKKCGG